jgi:hypothetical protein
MERLTHPRGPQRFLVRQEDAPHKSKADVAALDAADV